MPVDFNMLWMQEYQFAAGAEKTYPIPVKNACTEQNIKM